MDISITFHHMWGGSMFWNDHFPSPFWLGYDPDKKSFFAMMHADKPANDNSGPEVAA